LEPKDENYKRIAGVKALAGFEAKSEALV